MSLRFMVCLLIAACVASCGGSGNDTGTATQVNEAIAVAMVSSAPIASCPNGGMTVQSGIDTNANQILELSEATNAQYICNGVNGTDGMDGMDGAMGTSSYNAQIAVTTEPIGSHCSDGGSLVNVGWDVNNNAILDASEITSFSYICKGVSGLDGFNGSNGSNGFSTISVTLTESAGANCINGGQKTTMGLDVNSNSVIDLSEVTSTTYVCNGSNGSTGSAGANGLDSLVAINSLKPGENCIYGGSVLTSGLDRNANRVLDEEEITARTYICNAAEITKPAYAYIYNLSEQVVAVDAPVLFDRNGLLSEFEHTVRESGIRVLSAGIYTVAFSISGTEPNQFAIFVNDILVPGSIYGSGAGTQQNSGQITLALKVADLLTLVNYSSAAAVGLASKVGGTQENVNASVRIQKIN